MTYTFLIMSSLCNEYYRIEEQDRICILSMQKSRTTQQENMKRNQIFVGRKTVRLICISLSKNVTEKCLKGRLFAFTQLCKMFSPLINSIVDNGSLQTRQSRDQTRVHKEMTFNDTTNDSKSEKNHFYHNIVIAKVLKCDIRISTLRN